MSPCVSQSLRSDASSARVASLPVSPSLSSLCLLCGPDCDASFGVVPPACGQMPDAVTLAPAPCFSQSLQSDARRCDAVRGRVLRLSPCVSQSLRSDGSGVVSPACLSAFVSPACLSVSRRRCLQSRLCGRMPDAVTLAPVVSSPCLPVSGCQML